MNNISNYKTSENFPSRNNFQTIMIQRWYNIMQNSSPWNFYRISFDLLIITNPLNLIQWFLLSTITMALTTYFNVSFFSTITLDVTQGLKYLLMLIITQTASSYCSLRLRLVKKTFILDFLEQFLTKINQRILSANWIQIKLSDQVEIRRKIEEACCSVLNLVEDLIDKFQEVSKFLVTILTIFYICPLATIVIGIIYMCFYRFYLSKQSDRLLDTKLKIIERNEKLNSKYTRANANMFEYVIHHEKNHIIRITNELKVDIERAWFDLDQLYDYLSLKEDIIGKLCTFVIIGMYYSLNGATTFILPLYHYLSTLTDSIDTLFTSYIRWLRLKKDYDLIQPILEESHERSNVEQIDLQSQLQIRDLSFHYSGTRQTFHLQLPNSLTFKMGEAILITGKSGAGKIVFRQYHPIS